MNPSEVLLDWQRGLTVKQIIDRYSIPDEYSFAILYCSGGLAPFEILERLRHIKYGMSASTIKAVMAHTWSARDYWSIFLMQICIARKLRSIRILFISLRSLIDCLRVLRNCKMAQEIYLSISIIALLMINK